MSVIVHFRGRLGNNLFQYAIGRIIAEELGFSLNCQSPGSITEGAPKFSADSTLVGLARYFPNVRLRIDGSEYVSPVESYELSSIPGWKGQTVDFNAILSNKLPRQIRLEGYFQRYEYLREHKANLRRWFYFDKLPLSFPVERNDVLVSIRRGMDVGLNRWVLPLSYYDGVLTTLPDIGKVYVCGTEINEDVYSKFRKYNPTYFLGSPMEQFSFVTRFRRIVLSNSTFMWWAAFLSDAEELYAPHSAAGRCYAFTGFEDVSLGIDEDRYKQIAISASVTVGFALQNLSSPSHLHRYENSIVISSAFEPSHSVRVGHEHLHFMEWLVQQRRPFEYSAIDTGVNLHVDHLLSDLVKNHIVRVIPIYRESPSDERTKT